MRKVKSIGHPRRVQRLARLTVLAASYPVPPSKVEVKQEDDDNVDTVSETSSDLAGPPSDFEGAARLSALCVRPQPQVNSSDVASGTRVAEAQPNSGQAPRTVRKEKKGDDAPFPSLPQLGSATGQAVKKEEPLIGASNATVQQNLGSLLGRVGG